MVSDQMEQGCRSSEKRCQNTILRKVSSIYSLRNFVTALFSTESKSLDSFQVFNFFKVGIKDIIFGANYPIDLRLEKGSHIKME